MSKTPRITKSEAIRTLAAYGHAACDRVEQLETELADKDRQLAEAYDYAATLLMGIVKNYYPPIEGFGPFPKPDVLGVLTQIDNAYTGVRDQLYEARAEIERKDKLIEQMRDALRQALPEARSTHAEQTILAALAAERGR